MPRGGVHGGFGTATTAAVDPNASRTEEFLASQIRQLQKQVTFYREVISQHNAVLVEVNEALGSDNSVRQLQRKVVNVMKMQGDALEVPGCDNTAGSEERVSYSPPGSSRGRDRGGASGGLQEVLPVEKMVVRDIGDELSTRLLAVAARMGNIWWRSAWRKVNGAVELTREAFDAFNAQPTERTIDGFSEALEEMMARLELIQGSTDSPQKAAASSGDSANGNPFEVADDELTSFFKKTITDCVESHWVEARQVYEAKALQDEIRRGEKSGKPAAQRSNRKAPTTEASQTTGADGPRQRPPMPKQSTIEPEEALPIAPAGGRPPRITPHHVDEAAFHPRVTTPSRQDSAQMRTLLGGGQAGHYNTSTPRGSKQSPPTNILGAPDSGRVNRPATEPAGEGENRLAQLRDALHRAELQMHAGVGHRDTGSEARHYALSRKIMMIKAEILKEEKVERQLQDSREEVDHLRYQRERKQWDAERGPGQRRHQSGVVAPRPF